ncbi:hypothetical protein P5V15_013056 [Pogonomyrmex californicus]
MLSDLTPQELHVSQLERYETSALRRDAESALFAIPLGLTRHRYSKEALRAVLDARCIVDGSIQEAARWPTECQVKVNAPAHFSCRTFSVILTPYLDIMSS